VIENDHFLPEGRGQLHRRRFHPPAVQMEGVPLQADLSGGPPLHGRLHPPLPRLQTTPQQKSENVRATNRTGTEPDIETEPETELETFSNSTKFLIINVDA
jgi:hypothetical protein